MKDILSKEKRYCTNEDYILREIAGETILVPTGASADHFNGMLTLNETSRFLWELFRRTLRRAKYSLKKHPLIPKRIFSLHRIS